VQEIVLQDSSKDDVGVEKAFGRITQAADPTWVACSDEFQRTKFLR
jgi:hypothetical protein